MSKQDPQVCAILFHPFDQKTMSFPPHVVLAQQGPHDFTEFVNTCMENFPPVKEWNLGHLRVLFGRGGDEAILSLDRRKGVGLLGVRKSDLRQFFVTRAAPLFK